MCSLCGSCCREHASGLAPWSFKGCSGALLSLSATSWQVLHLRLSSDFLSTARAPSYPTAHHTHTCTAHPQVLHFHALRSANGTGAFFPEGVRGRINRPDPLQVLVRGLLGCKFSAAGVHPQAHALTIQPLRAAASPCPRLA